MPSSPAGCPLNEQPLTTHRGGAFRRRRPIGRADHNSDGPPTLSGTSRVQAEVWPRGGAASSSATWGQPTPCSSAAAAREGERCRLPAEPVRIGGYLLRVSFADSESDDRIRASRSAGSTVAGRPRQTARRPIVRLLLRRIAAGRRCRCGCRQRVAPARPWPARLFSTCWDRRHRHLPAATRLGRWRWHPCRHHCPFAVLPPPPAPMARFLLLRAAAGGRAAGPAAADPVCRICLAFLAGSASDSFADLMLSGSAGAAGSAPSPHRRHRWPTRCLTTF